VTDDEKFNYWLKYARYDLDSADVMHKSRRWLYVVFMCQQALEKLCKGLYLLYVDDNIPRLHNINAVFSRFADKLSEPLSYDYRELFDRLSLYYLETRYPEYKNNLSDVTDENVASHLLLKTKEVFQWLLTLKP
jgi:HEPN domain-containing protein